MLHALNYSRLKLQKQIMTIQIILKLKTIFDFSISNAKIKVSLEIQMSTFCVLLEWFWIFIWSWSGCELPNKTESILFEEHSMHCTAERRYNQNEGPHFSSKLLLSCNFYFLRCNVEIFCSYCCIDLI